MTLETWLTFIITATVILAIPGPTIVYVISQSLTHGKKARLPLAYGVALGDATCILLSLVGLSALLMVSAFAFTLLKTLGAAYLISLGLSMLKNGMSIENPQKRKESFNSKSLLRNSFAITSLNPKGIIFHSAFMPQFINPLENIYLQFSILGLSFIGLALLNTLVYSLLAGKFSEMFSSEKSLKWFSYGGGLSLIGAGLLTTKLKLD